MRKITIYEVGPRDGLQSEKQILPPEKIAAFIDLLSIAGLSAIEMGAFVSPHKVPQMANTKMVAELIHPKANTRYITLVPNQKGMEEAVKLGIKEVAVFTGASDAFLQNNIHCTIEESFERFKPVLELAKRHHIHIQGYISCAFGCPFTGVVSKQKVAEIAHRLYGLGCREIRLSDTIAGAKPDEVPYLIEKVAQGVPLKHLAVHFHDSEKRLAIPNVLAAVTSGIPTVDSAVGNLGGCPYAPGASGNVATELVVETLHHAGLETGVNLASLLRARNYIFKLLGREPGT